MGSTQPPRQSGLGTLFFWVQSSQGVSMITYSHLVLRLKMCEAIPFLPSKSSQRIQTTSPLLYLVSLFLVFLISCLLLSCHASVKKQSNDCTGKTKSIMWFKVLTVVLLRIQVAWDVTLCHCVCSLDRNTYHVIFTTRLHNNCQLQHQNAFCYFALKETITSVSQVSSLWASIGTRDLLNTKQVCWPLDHNDQHTNICIATCV